MTLLKKIIATWLLLGVTQTVSAMPVSQLWLAEEQDGALSVTPISAADGYHNQPLVVDNGVYFTQQVSSEDGAQTDLFFYDFTTQVARNLTNTPVSEYSPTLYPHGDGLSAVVVEADGSQKLWYYPFSKELSPQRLFAHIAPVGYHAWGDNEQLVMFILGEPHTLQFTDLSGHLPKVVARDIGRTLAYNAARKIYSFTYTEQGQQWFASFDAQTQVITEHFALPAQVQYYTWFDDNTVAYAIAGRIYTRHLDNPDQVTLWRNLSAYCSGTISRLSKQGGRLVFVCDPAKTK
ncbi:hypothetical protein CWB99_04620 [Pseudoalteromonas rubra]|uniref:Uncharacterized protein n=1 Tax=Pseudoalteromonas rubra TaxID=43658 RepID=A0A5S3WTL6_9GAMM|nr:hypothetical protein [Pseudoalteromonas rubra]TMP31541.1 hypothetical protein CWB99_04620 [Pseudoalteromonas rubra]TMP34625.1 hypothetical protein CWC00_07525 [Pseudoalteromonas rubra]